MHFFKYHFNPGTYLRYPTGRQMTRGIKFLVNAFCTAILLATALIVIHDLAFDSETTKKMRAENALLSYHQPTLERRLDGIEQTLTRLLKIDKTLHTKLFDTAPGTISQSTIDKERVLLASAGDFRSIIGSVDRRATELVAHSARTNAEFGATLHISREKIETLQSIPTIQPVDNTQIDLLVSGFGERINPFHKGMYNHPGVDFAAPRGSAVFATAPGRVITVKKTSLAAGYGNYIEIDHGNGYVTRYAHLDAVDVRRGQRVYKGKVIGSSGNSGGSVAPHLHYEVIKNGEAVDPVNYLLEGLSSSQYSAVLSHAAAQNQSLD
ncbi:M23 family metallopeptidase [Chryseolinea sp. T2]|uniref:M23 family metallopeptidase n=1 Tax=Chryseolinea sp. T2 TaxID=3129255 RepID=UPI0030773F72